MTRVNDSRSTNVTGSFHTEQLFIPTTYTGTADISRTDFSFQSVVSTLYRYRVLIAIITLLTFLLAVILTFTRKIEPTYQAQAMVSVGRYIPPILGPTGRLLRETTSERSYVADQLPLLTSYTIAELVLRQEPAILEYIETGVIPEGIAKNLPSATRSKNVDLEKLISKDVIKKAESETTDPNAKSEIGENSRINLSVLKAYLELIDYEHVRNTSMVAITAESVRPALSARIANAHAQMFIALVRAKLLDNARVNLKFLQDRKAEAQEKAELTRKNMVQYAEDNGILVGGIPSSAVKNGDSLGGSLLAIEYRDLTAQLSMVTKDRSRAESEHRALQASGSGGGRFYQGIQDRNMAIDLANRKAELKSLRKSGIKSSNPYLKELERQVKLFQEIIDADRKNELKDHEVRVRALRDQERLMFDAMKNLKERSVRESKTQMRYTILIQEDRAAQDLLAELTKRLEEVYIHLNSNQSHVRMIDEARAPKFSRARLDYLNLILGAVLGPFMGIALAFALDLLDNTVRTVADLQRVINVPLLGIIPRFTVGMEEMIASSFQELPEGEVAEGLPNGESYEGGNGLAGLKSSSEAGVDTSQSPSVLVGGPSLAGAWSTDVRQKLELPDDFGDQNTFVGTTPVDPSTEMFTEEAQGADTGVSTSVQNKSDTLVGQQISESAPPAEALADAPASQGGEGGGTTIITSSSLVLVSAPHSLESEAFRNVRTCVTYGCTDKPPKLVLVTSGQKSDGKTTVACNLAISLAQVSERTLLIDSDLRLPAIHKNFSLSRLTPGLSDYLRGFRDYGEVIFETPIPNLCLMLAGEPCPNPTELVGSKRMAELLELLTDEFDHIIIDSPPVTRVADAMLLSRLVEGVVLVVRSGKTPEPVAENAFQRLKQMDANILGTVLNDVVSVPGYRDAEYYYLSESYYGPESYGEGEEEEHEHYKEPAPA